MSDNIDYDELDRAIAESQKKSTRAANKNAVKVTSKTATKAANTNVAQKITVSPKTAPKPVAKAAPKNLPKAASIPVFSASKPAAKPVQTEQDIERKFPPRRRVYMDFIGKPRQQKAAQAPTSINVSVAKQPEAPKRVAHFATATPGMPSYRVANSHQQVAQRPTVAKPLLRRAAPATSTVKPAGKQIVAPKMPTRVVKPAAPSVTRVAAAAPAPVVRPAAKPVAAPVVKPAPKIVEKPAEKPVVKAEPVTNTTSATAIAANNAVKAIKQGPSAPNANNFSLGVRSPYIRKDAKVEKRPLSNDISEYVQDDRIEKNEYPEKSAKNAAKKKRDKHTIKKNNEKNSNWYWPILVVLIVAAGGGLGYLVWFILQNAS